MKYLKYSDQFLNERFINEGFNERLNEGLNEGLNISKYQNISKKIIKDLKVNLYFISTFGTSVSALYPLITSIVKNTEIMPLTTTDIVFLTICALAITFKESKSEIDKLMVIVNEKGLQKPLEKIQYFLKNFTTLFSAIAKSTGKIINGMVDMFAYTALLVPTIMGVVDLINTWKINFESFDQIMVNPMGFAISTGVGIITITVKHLIGVLVKKIKRLTTKKEAQLKNPVFTGESLNVDKIMEYLKS